jgi:peptide/nickel transport system substrate-binding protein
MEGALSLGVAVPIATSLWSREVKAATPRTGGTFRAGLLDANTTDSLDPGTAAGLFSIHLNKLCRSYLTEITPDNVVGGDSAESWEASPDAKQWRFKLYKGQQFHNGKPLEASDVVASLNFHRTPDSKSGAKGLLSDVEEIKADGKDTVVVTMKIGTADLPYLLTDYHMPIMPGDGEGKVDWQSGIGAGPYKLEEFQPGISAKGTRHPNYHRQTYFDAVNMIGINDANARVNSLISGEVDAISDVDLKTVSLLSNTPGIEIDVVPSGQLVTMDMQCNQAPFDNPDVRLALKYALNRQEILDKIVMGFGSLGNDHPIGSSIPFHANIEQRPYDPDKAKHHWKKAGAEGITIPISTADIAYNGAVDMCVLYQQSAAKAGIKIDVIREPNDGYWSNIWLQKPYVVVSYGQRATPDMMFSTFYRDGAPWNSTKWHDDKFQKLLLDAKAELDEKKRAAMYAEMQQLCRDDGGTVVPFFFSLVDARRSNVKHGPKQASDWQMEGGRAYQRWWFEE